MKDTKFRILLDIHEVRSQATIPVKVGDVSCKIYITLVEGGKPYKIHENSFGVFTGQKGDDNYLFNNCVIENGVIRYDFTPQTVAAAGILECEVRIYDEDGGVLTTPSFTIVVDERAVKDSDLASSNEFSFLDEIIVNEGQRIKNEEKRIAAFNNFGIDLEDDGEVINIVKTDIDGSQEKSTFLKYADVIPSVTATASGKAITIESANAPLQSLKLFGKTEQDGTPTPTEPKELKSVGDSGSFEVGLFGKNKLEITMPTRTEQGITYTVNSNKSINISGTTTSTSIVELGEIKNNLMLGKTYKMINLFACRIVKTDGTTIYSNNEFTFTSDISAIYPYLQIGGAGVTVNATVYPMIIEATETDTTFEPCNKQTLTLPYTLPSGNEIDFARGVLISRSENISGNELVNGNWILETSYPRRFYISLPGKYVYGKGLSSHFVHQIDADLRFYFAGGINVYDLNSKWASVEIFKNWLSENDVKFILELATPIETPLTETELNAYRQLYTNKGNTTILSEADMEVDYYINKPNAQAIGNIHSQVNKDYFKLQQAIISTGGN